MTRRKLPYYLICVALVGLLLSLAFQKDPDPDAFVREFGPSLILIQKVDCSISMAGALPELAESAARVTQDGARPLSRIIGGSFIGNPSHSRSPWPVEFQYPTLAEGQNPNLVRERVEVAAKDRAREIAKLFECEERQEVGPDPQEGERGWGTPLLSVLAQCSDLLERVDGPEGASRRIVIYTDGVLIGDGVDARDGISDADARALTKRFSARLRNLEGTKVWMVGAGAATGIPDATMQRIRRMFEEIIDQAGGELVSFNPSLTAYPFRKQPTGRAS